MRDRLSQISYVILIQRLISSQYIDEGQLPNANGEFTLPPLYTAQQPTDSTMQSPYSLTLGHCTIPKDQLIKLGLEVEEDEVSSMTHCGGTQVFETEKDFIATQTEVDQSFDLDMEIRTPSEIDEVHIHHKLPETPSRPSFKSPLVNPPPFSLVMSSVAMSLPSGNELTSKEETLVDSNGIGDISESASQNFFTQNMTQESLLEMEKWLLSSSTQEDPITLENGQKHVPVGAEREDDYHVSSDDEPTHIKHYPLSANPKFLHKEIPPETSPDVSQILPNGEVTNPIHGEDLTSVLCGVEEGSQIVDDICPEMALIGVEESQTQPQMVYMETMNGQQSHSVLLPDTLTSSWESPPDIDVSVQVSPSTPSQNELIGRQFFKNFPGIGMFRATVSEFHWYLPTDSNTSSHWFLQSLLHHSV